MRYPFEREPELCKRSEEELVPIETLLRKQSKGQFLNQKQKARIYKYEAEKRGHKPKSKKRK